MSAFHVADAHSGRLVRRMGNARLGNPMSDPLGWARRCRIETARAIHPSTKTFLDELASEFEALAGEMVKLDPDDPELQGAVGDRLAELAARDRSRMR